MYKNYVPDQTEAPDESLRTATLFTRSVFFLIKGQMLVLRSFPLWLLVALLQQQVYPVSAADAGGHLPSGAQQNGGRFSTSDETRCTWSARDTRDSVILRVKCRNPGTRFRDGTADFSCRYAGKPESCQGYRSNPRGFWKQVARALKKLRGRLCRDERALVRAGMCKRTQRDVHFQLDVNSSVFYSKREPGTPPSSTSSVSPTVCTRHADHRETAEEYCSGAWASVCAFFLSMLQRDAC